jgi:hypothetical protein
VLVKINREIRVETALTNAARRGRHIGRGHFHLQPGRTRDSVKVAYGQEPYSFQLRVARAENRAALGMPRKLAECFLNRI